MDSKIQPRVTRMPGDENYIEDLQAQFDWQIALTRAMAEYWRDPEGNFAKRLLSTNPDTVAKLFEEELRFELPPGLKLTFKEVDIHFKGESKGEPKGEPKKEPPHNGWIGSLDKLSAEVVIPLPRPPSLNDRARAISDYVATGKAYPFT